MYAWSHSELGERTDTFVYDGSAHKITVPTGLTKGTQLFVMYDYETEEAVQAVGDAINFPKAGKFVMEILGSDVCNPSEKIHAYVVFCNNNEYGDSRVRVPRKDRWARDIVEVRGGDDPYYAIGKLEIDELREFQSHANPNLLKDAKFKPLPMGFEMDSNRRVDV